MNRETREEYRARYHRFLREDPEWKAACRAVWKRCKGVCERCQHHSMADTHHIDYSKGWLPPLDWLEGLCTGCHKFKHGLSDDDPLDLSLEVMLKRIDAAFSRQVCAPESPGPIMRAVQKPLPEWEKKCLRQDRELESIQDGLNEAVLSAPKSAPGELEKAGFEKCFGLTTSGHEPRPSHPQN